MNALNIAASGMRAAEVQLAVAANNIANARSTGKTDPAAPGQAPYAAQRVDQTAVGPGQGTLAVPRLKDPATVNIMASGEPWADGEGQVAAPNVNLEEEMVSLLQAKTAYSANAVAFKAAAEMERTLFTSRVV